MSPTPVPVSLRDELAAMLGPAFAAETGTTWLYDKGQFVADAVLGSEALQSIRWALMRAGCYEAGTRKTEKVEKAMLTVLGLSPSVVAWVMGDGE